MIIKNNIKQQYIKDFFNSVKIHINKVSEYISLDLDNAPYAIMFIPSEAITSFIFNEHHELIDLAFSKKVIICSPSTLMAIIESIDYYLKIFNDIKNIDQNLKIIKEVERSMENYDMAIDNLEKAANIILLKIKEVKIKENTLMGKYKKINKINNTDDDL